MSLDSKFLKNDGYNSLRREEVKEYLSDYFIADGNKYGMEECKYGEMTFVCKLWILFI